MSYSVKKGNITLTRGDTFKAQLSLVDSETQNPYVFETGDRIQFGVKKSYTDEECIIFKEVPTDTLILTLIPEDTKTLDFGDYVYDVQLVKSSGEIYTFITTKTLTLTEEVV